MKLYEAYQKLVNTNRSKEEYYDDSCVVMGLSMTPAMIAKQYMRGGDLPPALTPLPNEDEFVPRQDPKDLGEAMQQAVDFVNSVSTSQSVPQQQSSENNPVSGSNPEPTPEPSAPPAQG